MGPRWIRHHCAEGTLLIWFPSAIVLRLERSYTMSPRFTLLFICDSPAACSAFHDDLLDAGFRVLGTPDIESAVLCSYVEHVDRVLIYQDDVRLGTVIGCDMKPMFPGTPVVLISTGFETMAPSSGIDAICYSNSLDEETSQVIAMLFRNLLNKQQNPTNDRLEPVYERPGPFLVQRP